MGAAEERALECAAEERALVGAAEERALVGTAKELALEGTCEEQALESTCEEWSWPTWGTQETEGWTGPAEVREILGLGWTQQTPTVAPYPVTLDQVSVGLPYSLQEGLRWPLAAILRWLRTAVDLRWPRAAAGLWRPRMVGLGKPRTTADFQ